MKQYALDLNKEQWAELLAELGEPKFRADQLLQWLWQKKVFDAEEMTNLSKTLREKLAETIDFAAPVLIREQKSKDGTRKYLWQLRDGNSVESVLLKSGSRLTACISTQVGCPLGCTFCATGLSGFVRNLSSGEIAGQFLAMEAKLAREINNIVYMGMGEPMLNKDAVFKSVRMLNDEKLRGLGIRHITISTSGVVPGIQAMAEEQLGARLAVSLHAVDDELRSRLMPVNEHYPLAELKEAIKNYQETTGDRVSIEYTLFGGVNDSVEHARALVRFLKGIHVFINLIPFNPVDNRYDAPEARDILKFRKVLETAGFENELREEQGSDIDAACGQLRRKDMEGAAVAFEPVAYSVTRKDGRREANTKDQRPNTNRDAASKRCVEWKKLKPLDSCRKHAGMTGGELLDSASARRMTGGKPSESHRGRTEDYEGRTAKNARQGAKGARRQAKDEGNKFYENIKGVATRPRRKKEDADFEKSEKKTPGKKTLPEKERYRSGKMKEERPVYRGNDGGKAITNDKLPNTNRGVSRHVEEKKAKTQDFRQKRDRMTGGEKRPDSQSWRGSQKDERKNSKRGARK